MWEYEVKHWEDDKDITEHGIVAGFDIVDAIKNLVDRFGEKNIETVKLVALRDDFILPYREGTISLKYEFQEE